MFAPGILRVVEGEEVDWASIWSLARLVVAEVCDAALVAALVVYVWLDHVISRGKPDAVVLEAILLGARPRIEVRIEVAVDSHLVAISDFRIWEGKICNYGGRYNRQIWISISVHDEKMDLTRIWHYLYGSGIMFTYGSWAWSWRRCLICEGALSIDFDWCKATGSGGGGGCLGVDALCRCDALGAVGAAAWEYSCCAAGRDCRSYDLQFTLSPFIRNFELIF